MRHNEFRSHELHIEVEVEDLERFAHHKRYTDGITIAVNRVTVAFEIGDRLDARNEHVSVSLYGNGVLKSGDLGTERDDRHLDLSVLPPSVRRIVDARIAKFKADIGRAL